MVIYAQCTSSKNNSNNNNNNKKSFLKTGTDYVGSRHFALSGCYATFCFRQRQVQTQLRSATKRFLVTHRCIAKRYEALCNARLMQLIPDFADIQADLSLRWAQMMSEGTFSHEAVNILLRACLLFAFLHLQDYWRDQG